MNRTNFIPSIRTGCSVLASLLLAGFGINDCLGYDSYSDAAGGCVSCHGNFRGSTSTKGTIFPSNNNHEMHRNSASMGTACNLCHSGTSRFPVYIGRSNGTANNVGLGCSGCHQGDGLRKHHFVNGVTECYDCHSPATPPSENIKPPYYGTADTKVNNPGNTVLAANTNENWSIGDFIGLDNDGNNLYDLADYAVGPFRLLSATPEGNNMRVTWLTAGGRDNNIVQAAGAVDGSYANLGTSLTIPEVGLVTTNFLDIGGATNKSRFYRLKAVAP